VAPSLEIPTLTVKNSNVLRVELCQRSAGVTRGAVGRCGSEVGSSKPKVYEFTIRLYCFCRISALSREPIVFRVEGGKPSLISGESVVADLFRSRGGMDKYASVERQFDFIRGELAKGNYLMETDYDQQLGYPKRIFIDTAQNTTVRRIPDLPQSHF
jgi:hypothetical protein